MTIRGVGLIVVLLIHLGCDQPEYRHVRLDLPQGDVDSGRQAFQDLKCTVCHVVAGETSFPAPFSETPGPVLDSAIAFRSTGDVLTAIIAPSHSIVNASEDVRMQMDGVLSPMGDYSRAMSVRQMLDLVAYLRAIPE